VTQNMLRLLRAWLVLVYISFRRLLWSANTLMVLVPLVACAVFLVQRNYPQTGYSEQNFDQFSRWFMIRLFMSFILPLVALAYGTASVGGDREDRTLLFILVRPIPRSLVVLGKFVATLPLALGLVLCSFYLFCVLAGEMGTVAFHIYLPAVFLATLAYVALFHFFSVAFRHATIVAVVYSFFLELLVGNAPGVIKRLAINYYARSLMYSAGRLEGVQVPDPRWFEPLSPPTAEFALLGFAVAGLLAALVVFQRREYKDVT
jgi:ABC-2 type transport system permease protein